MKCLDSGGTEASGPSRQQVNQALAQNSVQQYQPQSTAAQQLQLTRTAAQRHAPSSNAEPSQTRPADNCLTEMQELLSIVEADDEAKKAEQIRQDAALALQLQAQDSAAERRRLAAVANLSQQQEPIDVADDTNPEVQTAFAAMANQHADLMRRRELAAGHDHTSTQTPGARVNAADESAGTQHPEHHASRKRNSSSLQECQRPGECLVCWEHPSNRIFSCGHLCVCANCSKSLRKCPMCRKPGKAFAVYM